ncbi:MAG: hypothetical protein IRZ33_03230 [Alicyclobacillaceae bacterium]|nr:hypothetical protein [Alicyclobacillaceae bacterium]
MPSEPDNGLQRAEAPLPEHNEYTESVVDSIDRMRNDGGLAPELPHRRAQSGDAPGARLRDSLDGKA